MKEIFKSLLLIILLALVFLLIPCNYLNSQTIGLSVVSGINHGCSPLELCFQNTSLSNGIDHFEWDFNNDGIADEIYGPENAGQTICHTFSSNPLAGRVFLIGVRTDGTQDGAFVNISVYRPNVPAIGSLPALVCSGGVELTNSSMINDDGSVHITTWDFDDGSSLLSTDQLTVNHIFIKEGQRQVTMIDSNSCGSDSISSILRVELLNSVIGCNSGDTVCSGEEIQFSNSDHSPTLVYNWDFGDGGILSTQSSPVYRYTSPGNYIVNLSTSILEGIGCTKDTFLNIEVLPGPVAEFITGSAPGQCDTIQVSFSDLSTEIQPGDLYQWEFNNGTSSQTSGSQGPVEYSPPGYYYPVLSITRPGNSCVSTWTDTLLVPETPQPDFSATQVCLGLPALFTDISQVAVPGINQYFWDFGDGTTDTVSSPSHVFTTPGEKAVMYHVSNGYCTNDTAKIIMVEDLPHPVFDLNTLSGCSELNIFTDNQTVDAIEYTWYFGDTVGITARDTTVVLKNPGLQDSIFTIKLLAKTAFGCTDTFFREVTVFASPVASFISDMDPVPACVPDTVNFVSLTKGNTILEWDMGDNSRSEDSTVTHIFTNNEPYFKYFQINLIATLENGCSDTASAYLTIYPRPFAGFVIDTLLKECGIYELRFTAAAEFNGGYTWIFEPGDTLRSQENQIVHEFMNQTSSQAIIPVELEVRNQFFCTGDTIINLELPAMPPSPTADYTVEPIEGCPDLEVRFTDQSLFADSTSYIWDFDDGTYSYERNPLHIFRDNGPKNVRLTVSGFDCTEDIRDTVIRVYERPSAAFNLLPETAWIPDQPVIGVPVYNNEEYRYSWDFGDGFQSDSMETVHFYQDTGSYRIQLIVITENDCSDTAYKYLNAKTSGNIDSPNVFFPEPGGGDGSGNGIAGSGDDVFAPVTTGVSEYHLEIYDRWGEKLFTSDDKEIGWTGYYKGRLCKEDVYVWRVSGRFANDVSFVRAGSVTLIQKAK